MLSREQLKHSRFFILFMSALVALAPLSIDMYMPAMGQMAELFEVSFSEVNLTMSAYLFGNAIGQFFGGSLSDQLGRKKIGVIGLSIFFLASLAISFSPSIEFMQLARIIQAIGGGLATVICIAQVRDIFPVEQVMKKYADVVLVMMIAPILAPTIGVALLQFGWQSIFLALAAISALLLLNFIFVIPETRQNIRNRVVASDFLSGYWKVLNHRVEGRITGTRYVLYTGFSSGVFFCFLTNASMIFMNHYGFGELQFAIGFALIACAMIAGNRLAVRMSRLMPAENWLKRATLVQIICTLSLVSLSLSGLQTAWTTALLIFVTIAMSGSIMPTTSGRYIAFFDDLSGSAASLSTTVSFGLGAIIGAIAAVLARTSITPVFLTMAVSAMIAYAILMTINLKHATHTAEALNDDNR